MRSLIVTPTYNEAGNVRDLVGAILRHAPEAHVLVVDDNSPDGTAGIVTEMSAKDPRVHLLLRAGKEGLAAAYTDGLKWGLAAGYDAIVQMDADLSHPPELLPRMLGALSAHSLVLGCRYANGGAVSGWGLHRKIISWGGNTYARAVLGLPFHDLTGGYIAWRRELLEKIRVGDASSRGYAYLIELKYRAFLCDARAVEIPFTFVDRTRGKSKMSPWIFSEAAAMVLWLRWNRARLTRELAAGSSPREIRAKA